jgi:hypothetical protein
MRKLALGVLALSLLLAPATASATTVYAYWVQTQTAQFFTVLYGGLAPSTGAGTFTVHARGDYSLCGQDCKDQESLFWNIDSIVTGYAGPEYGATILQDFDFNDKEWTQTFLISAAAMALITGDASLNLSAQLGSDVNEYFSANPFVELTLQYPHGIPEPTATLPLLGLALGALAWTRRKFVG